MMDEDDSNHSRKSGGPSPGAAAAAAALLNWGVPEEAPAPADPQPEPVADPKSTNGKRKPLPPFKGVRSNVAGSTRAAHATGSNFFVRSRRKRVKHIRLFPGPATRGPAAAGPRAHGRAPRPSQPGATAGRSAGPFWTCGSRIIFSERTRTAARRVPRTHGRHGRPRESPSPPRDAHQPVCWATSKNSFPAGRSLARPPRGAVAAAEAAERARSHVGTLRRTLVPPLGRASRRSRRSRRSSRRSTSSPRGPSRTRIASGPKARTRRPGYPGRGAAAARENSLRNFPSPATATRTGAQTRSTHPGGRRIIFTDPHKRAPASNRRAGRSAGDVAPGSGRRGPSRSRHGRDSDSPWGPRDAAAARAGSSAALRREAGSSRGRSNERSPTGSRSTCARRTSATRTGRRSRA